MIFANSDAYVDVLLRYAFKENKIESYFKQVKFLKQVLINHHELLNFLSDINISKNQRQNAFLEIFKDQLETKIIYFIFVVIDFNRVRDLLGILNSFIEKCNDHFGIVSGTLYTAKALTDDQVKAIRHALELKFNQKVELSNMIDPSIIGGIRFESKNYLFDNSFSSKLKKIKSEILSSFKDGVN